jgi:hypothetical protein
LDYRLMGLFALPLATTAAGCVGAAQTNLTLYLEERDGPYAHRAEYLLSAAIMCVERAQELHKAEFASRAQGGQTNVE